MLKTVFVNSFSILSPMAHDKYRAELRAEIDTDDSWREFLNREVWVDELFAMSEKEKNALKEKYQDWLDDAVDENDMYEECHISYATEEGGDY